MPLRCWYNCGTKNFHQADFCLAEMKKPTMLRNKSSTAWSCAENQIFVGFLRIKSSEQDFKYLCWWISKILLWHIFTWKEIYMIDWVGRMGWLRLVGSLKSYVSFAEYSLFYRALLQKRPMIVRSLRIVATPYHSCWTHGQNSKHIYTRTLYRLKLKFTIKFLIVIFQNKTGLRYVWRW